MAWRKPKEGGRHGFLKDTFARDRCLTQKQDTADQLRVSFSGSLLAPNGFLPVHVTSNFGNEVPYSEKKKKKNQLVAI